MKVKTVSQLDRLRVAEEPKADSVAILAHEVKAASVKNELAALAQEIKAASSKAEIAALAQEIKGASSKSDHLITLTLGELHAAVEKFSRVPVEVNMPKSEKTKRWEFTCKYDHNNRLIGIVAEAKG